MKVITSILVFILLVSDLHAICSRNGLFVFPSEKSIRQNSIFVIDGYALSQDIIVGLNEEYPIYLVSGDHEVKLLVKEVLKGQFRLTQAVLIPESSLLAGLEYSIVIENLPPGESLKKWDSDLRGFEPIKYTVVQGEDLNVPEFCETPKLIKKSKNYYGCGPSMNVEFEFSIIETSEYLIRATVKNIKTGFESSYYLKPSNEKVKIGHGMCSGAFQFNDSQDYEVEFSILDASGNINQGTGDRIKFSKPSDNDVEHEDGKKYTHNMA